MSFRSPDGKMMHEWVVVGFETVADGPRSGERLVRIQCKEGPDKGTIGHLRASQVELDKVGQTFHLSERAS